MQHVFGIVLFQKEKKLMLEFFRNNIGGLLGGIIVGVLAFAFAFSFGTQSRGWGEGQAEQYAAVVIPEGLVVHINRDGVGGSLLL